MTFSKIFTQRPLITCALLQSWVWGSLITPLTWVIIAKKVRTSNILPIQVTFMEGKPVPVELFDTMENQDDSHFSKFRLGEQTRSNCGEVSLITLFFSSCVSVFEENVSKTGSWFQNRNQKCPIIKTVWFKLIEEEIHMTYRGFFSWDLIVKVNLLSDCFLLEWHMSPGYLI